jgi:hypothetical protein
LWPTLNAIRPPSEKNRLMLSTSTRAMRIWPSSLRTISACLGLLTNNGSSRMAGMSVWRRLPSPRPS